MKTRNTSILMQNKNILIIALAVAFVLLLWVSMQLSDEMDWGVFDFVFAGALLFGAGLAFELVSRQSGSVVYRAAVGVAAAAALLLIWVNLAVGVIGSEDNPANLMYGGVLAILLIGAVIARFRPSGMTRTLFATAIAQMVVPVLALIVWRPDVSSPEALMGVVKVFGVNAFFAAFWVASALLFRRASAILNE